MIVRNNYHWLDEDSPAGFLANGDFVEIMKIKREEEMHGQRFLDVTLRLCDYDDHPPIEAKILLETLHSAESALGKEANKKLYDSVCEDYAHIPKKKERTEALKLLSFCHLLLCLTSFLIIKSLSTLMLLKLITSFASIFLLLVILREIKNRG